jgi:RND family efflux transporter MFP subunit
MNQKAIWRASLFALGVGALAAFSTGCSRSEAQPKSPPPPAVTVAPVEQREIVEWREFTGRTEAVESVEVRPRVSGYIQEVRFQSGQLVRKGEVLFVIDPRWHQAEFARREAEAARAKVQLENASREAARMAQLLASKAISAEEAEARTARHEEAKAALLAAEAIRDSARLDLDYTQVRAPIDGRVSRAWLTEGNYVSGTAGAASKLTTIVSVSPVYVYADMDEGSLLRFNTLIHERKVETNAEGKIPVQLQLGDEEGYPRQGYVESLDNQLNPNTGSILLRAVFLNEDTRIVPGLFARIRVPLSARHSALLVDERAIGTDQAQKYVLTLSATNTVVYQPVQLGSVVDGKRVVSTGVRAGEEIVVNGMQRVRSGMAVAPERAIAREMGVGVQTAQR